MAILEDKITSLVVAEQLSIFESGNEMAAMAAAQINYHIMGYFPIFGPNESTR
jgi:pyruvate ferredoxin oxidoreductase alpha subunit